MGHTAKWLCRGELIQKRIISGIMCAVSELVILEVWQLVLQPKPLSIPTENHSSALPCLAMLAHLSIPGSSLLLKGSKSLALKGVWLCAGFFCCLLCPS